MDQLISYQAIFFPTDGASGDAIPLPLHSYLLYRSLSGRPPSVVQLMTRYELIALSISLLNSCTSPTQYGNNPGPRMPHPEAHMDFVSTVHGLRFFFP